MKITVAGNKKEYEDGITVAAKTKENVGAKIESKYIDVKEDLTEAVEETVVETPAEAPVEEVAPATEAPKAE